MVGKQVWCESPPLLKSHTHIDIHKYTRPPGTSCRTKWLAAPARHLPLSPGVRFGGSGCCSSPAGVHSLTHTHAHTHTRTETHSLLVSPAHPPPAFTPQTAGQQENTHTHTKEQTDAVTLEMQAKRCRGEKFSLKLENSLFISAFGLQEEFCLFVRFFLSL